MNLLHDINEIYFGPQWLKNWAGTIFGFGTAYVMTVFALALGQ